MGKTIEKLNEREKILIGMNAIVRSLNNEDAIEPWLMGGVPDGSDDEEICSMANDDATFSYCASLFLSIMSKKSAYKDGLYIDKKLKTITSESRLEN